METQILPSLSESLFVTVHLKALWLTPPCELEI